MSKIRIKESDVHHHLKTRMQQRGISIEEIEVVINEGWNDDNAKEGTTGKIFVFPHNADWEGKHFGEKEVTVYYKHKGNEFVLLTAKARYGIDFPKGGEINENRI